MIQTPHSGPWSLAWCLVLAFVACAPDPAIRVPPSDDVPTDTAVVDIELDGTDSLTDTISDTPSSYDLAVADAADVDANPSDACMQFAFDAGAGDDVPYWIANDIDLSPLGIVSGSAGCGNPYLTVQPDAKELAPACSQICPPPYACTCGACPWIQTPQMQLPRYEAQALWTGSEVLVFGGITNYGPDPQPFTAERWAPATSDGFSLVALPEALAVAPDWGDWMKAIWTGSRAFVFQTPHQFAFDPKTGVAQLLPLSPVTADLLNPAAVVVVAGQVYVWGWDRASWSQPLARHGRIARWSEATGWQDVPFPAAFLTSESGGVPHCMTALDDAIYVFDPPGARNATAGFDACLPIMLKYSTQTGIWTALPQNMVPGLRCGGVRAQIMFEAFPDGIAFIPKIGVDVSGVAHPPAGEIWWRKTGKWTEMHPPPIRGPWDGSQAIWTGTRFVLRGNLSGADPIVGDLLPAQDDYATWPLTYDPYSDKFGYMTSIGFPKHRRLKPAWAFSGTELFVLGGNGGVEIDTIYADGVRYHLPQP